jgi:hypothetical protein
LRIVSHFFSTEIGVATARQMEYPYPQNDQRKGYLKGSFLSFNMHCSK